MQKTKTPTAVVTAVLTLITLLFWTGFEVYRSLTAKPAPVVPVEIINPVDPTLDTRALDSLNNRLFLDETQIPNTQLSTSTPLPTLAPVPTATPVSSASALPTATP